MAQSAATTVYHSPELRVHFLYAPGGRRGDSISSMTACARAQSGVLGRLFLLLAFAVLATGALSAQTTDDGPLLNNSDTSRPPAVTNDTVIRMVKAGLDEPIILQTIRMQPGRYDVAPNDLIALKEAGVPAGVIVAMQARAGGLRSHDTAPAVTAPVPLALGLDEIGVYYKDKHGDWIPLRTERVHLKSSGWIKSTLTHGIIKEDMNGHLEGEHSTLVLKTGVELLIYAPAGTDGQEYTLLRLTPHKDSREFRTLTGGVFHSESGTEREEIEFNPKKIGTQMYTFTMPVDIEKGEYGVLPPGASNQRGFADTGKIFTFSIPE
jgi:hypothetical protein